VKKKVFYRPSDRAFEKEVRKKMIERGNVRSVNDRQKE